MPAPSEPLEKLGFLTIGSFDGADPRPGHEATLEVIELGTAVIPLGWENPLRLAEDLATVDILSGGRLNPGVSVGPPRHFTDVREALYPDTADAEDFSHERVTRLLRLVGGEVASGFSGTEGIEEFSDRVQPHSPGLRARMWYGAASLASARQAGEHAMHFLTSSV